MPDPLEELLDLSDSRIEPVHQFMTLRQLAQDFFESPELQILFMRAATTSTGCFPDDVPGLQGLIHCLPLTLSFEPAAIAVGGSQAISDALLSAGRKLGVTYETEAEVDRITTTNGRASGVELTDGARIEAGIVVSDLGLGQTVLRLLRDARVDHRLRRRIANIHYDRGQLLWANLAIDEPPRYLAEADNPGVGAQPRLYWGPKDLDYMHLRYQPEIFLHGFAGRPYVLCSVDSLWDSSRAPAGSHIVGVEEFSAPRRRFSAGEWRGVKERFTENLLQRVGGLRAEHDARERDRRTGVLTRGHRARAPEHDRGRLLGRQHDRVATRALPADPRPRRPPRPARQRLRLLGQPALGPGHRPRVELQLLPGDRPRPRPRPRCSRRMSDPARLAGRRIIVTGAAQGLGREFALHLASLGARVVAADIEEPGLRATSEAARERGLEVLPAVVDVRSGEQTLALAQTASDALGGVDALVNNAAIVSLPRRPFDEIPEDEWDQVLEVNVKGAWLCARAVAPLLRTAGGGSIVNLASEVAFSGSAGVAHYVASKAAIIGLTRVLARELGPAQIRVNALAPGFVPTEGSAVMQGDKPYDPSATPLGRVGQPADLLGTLAFLVSDESTFVTGQTLLVNGGRLFA